jgi:hypothetical protein
MTSCHMCVDMSLHPSKACVLCNDGCQPAGDECDGTLLETIDACPTTTTLATTTASTTSGTGNGGTSETTAPETTTTTDGNEFTFTTLDIGGGNSCCFLDCYSKPNRCSQCLRRPSLPRRGSKHSAIFSTSSLAASRATASAASSSSSPSSCRKRSRAKARAAALR